MIDVGRRIVVDKPFDQALRATVDALTCEGFCVTAADVQRMVRAGCRRYVLLTALHPEFVERALTFDLDIVALMPSHIALYELADGRTVVTASDPLAPVIEDRNWREENPALAQVGFLLEERLGCALFAIVHRDARRVAA